MEAFKHDIFVSSMLQTTQGDVDGLMTVFTNGLSPLIDKHATLKHISQPRFTHASKHKVKTLIMGSPSKSCCLDPAPIWPLKLYVRGLLPMISAMVNFFMDSGCVPPAFKCAQIRPLPTITILHPDILKQHTDPYPTFSHC